MAVSYGPSIQARERILAFGPPGVGKSNAILTVARRCPGSQFYVLDNDYAYDRLLATDFTELSNVEVAVADEWPDYVPQIKKWKEAGVNKDDWLVIDSMSATWPVVQSYFIEQVFGKEDDDYFLKFRMMQQEKGGRQKGESGNPLEGFTDWSVINKMYNRLYVEIAKWPGHVYLTAESEVISKDEKDRAVKATFGSFGVKPRGQKRLGHTTHTVLLMMKGQTGRYTVSTVKDRGRVELEDEEMGDFGKDYLVAVAKWRPQRVSE